MSLFEITSMEDEYKLFDDDPFLLDPEDESCLQEDASDESDSLTGTPSPLHHQYHQHQQKLQLQQQQQQLQLQQQFLVQQQQQQQSQILLPNNRSALKSSRKRPQNRVSILDSGVVSQDVYLEVHDYCVSSSQSPARLTATVKSEPVTSSDENVSDEQTIYSFDMDEEVDCDDQDIDRDDIDDEDEDDDEEDDRMNGTSSRKSSSSTSSPPSTLGHSRRKSSLDKSLSEEERRLLHKEGYTDFPENGILTKGDEKILRKIRRKIRNKKSAQCSRQRKKEYVEELEKKFSKCNNENLLLKKELVKLRRENSTLVMKIKNMVADGDSSSSSPSAIGDLSGQASFKTSFFVLCLSFFLIMFPFLAPEAMEDISVVMGKDGEVRMPGRNLLALVSNFSPSDVYAGTGGSESYYVASAINSSAAAASEPFFSFSF